MGLDMYLEGHKFRIGKLEDEQNREDGYPVKEKILELGYWRKHPNLHGYIVQVFAEGVDECQDIYLDETKLERLIEDVRAGKLIPTTGFFFGRSAAPGEPEYEEEKEYDLRILEGALAWLKQKAADPEVWRSVIYRASW
jgi:hypothetical protein